jgi:hypothetical protein
VRIVTAVEEAYAMLGVSPESFSQRLFPENPVFARVGCTNLRKARLELQNDMF